MDFTLEELTMFSNAIRVLFLAGLLTLVDGARTSMFLPAFHLDLLDTWPLILGCMLGSPWKRRLLTDGNCTLLFLALGTARKQLKGSGLEAVSPPGPGSEIRSYLGRSMR